jgi:hypothetical protein
MDEISLKPCPFCGEDNSCIEHKSGMFWPKCCSCLSELDSYHSKKEAEEAWNRRPEGELDLRSFLNRLEDIDSLMGNLVRSLEEALKKC